jgi:hypothetical protein
MKLRHKETGHLGFSDEFNSLTASEIIVFFEDGSCSSEFSRDYEVRLQDGTWKDLVAAFFYCDVIPDNYWTRFREAYTAEERSRGWY